MDEILTGFKVSRRRAEVITTQSGRSPACLHLFWTLIHSYLHRRMNKETHCNSSGLWIFFKAPSRMTPQSVLYSFQDITWKIKMTLHFLCSELFFFTAVNLSFCKLVARGILHLFHSIFKKTYSVWHALIFDEQRFTCLHQRTSLILVEAYLNTPW